MLFIKARARLKQGHITLNITSLMDILTIVLIYLVMAFSSEEQEVLRPGDIALPHSTTGQQATVNVTVSVARHEIRVLGVIVATLHDGAVASAQLDADRRITPLYKELQKQQLRVQQQVSTDGDDVRQKAEIIYVEADEAIAYDILDSVLKTAAAAGFRRFRLAALRTL